MRSAHLAFLAFWEFSASRPWDPFKFLLESLARHKLPSSTLVLHHGDLRLSWHLPAEHGYIAQHRLEMRESFYWRGTREGGEGKRKDEEMGFTKVLESFQIVKNRWINALILVS